MVRKPRKGWLMCVDYTNLNWACPKDSFPLPQIDQLVDATVGHAFFSFMDAYSGYNQILMHPEDQAHTSFIMDRGLYCYKVMPFGLKNAGATYQRLVNHLFAPLIGNTIEVYVDDMLVKSRTANKYIPNLSAMFTILKQYKMRLNPTKCAFGVASGKFLGFMIIQRGIEANPEKIQAILDMTIPKKVKDIQSLTGHVAALTRFISKATDRCAPFFKTLKGSKQSIISSVLIRSKDNAEHPVHYVSTALQDAEVRFSSYPISLITEPNLPPSQDHTASKGTFDLTQPLWTLFVDGSSNAQGCGAGLVLISPDKVALEYALRFKFQASNNEAECEALIAGLRLAKEMDAKQIQIFSDSQLVVHQVNQDFTAKDASMTAYLQHAQHLLATFHVHSINQVPRSENSHADALARLASVLEQGIGRHIHIEFLAQPSTQAPLICTIDHSPTCMDPILQFLQNQTLPANSAKARRVRLRSAQYLIINGSLYKRGFSLPYLRCLTQRRVIMSFEKSMKVSAATTRAHANWLIRQSAKDTSGLHSTLTPRPSPRNATSVRDLLTFHNSRQNH
ncbi:hypothetical protein L3X38_037483 [Prunus dulcis]|uniref:Reverse transcriptase domain-containing protein n=1 Tax=Prunus dulcis TaxID=3755 RepID=A0AAD4V5D2_PRUDU|nr:hypothetical protein L3X38_037483 [Prunus dulcis]